ncbi:MAG TPA: histidine kinase N-terminal 7TM domain-containing protein [Actinomycetaceae bacterium]|nr:histidine kinase N-terminal 7TM domain-containing protein [Actinomycetaceae bacterium]
MNWHSQSEPTNLLTWAIVAISVALGWYSWRRRGQPGARPFAVACLLAAVWALSMNCVSRAVTPISEIVWHTIRISMLLPLVCAVTAFVLEFVGHGKWLNHRLAVGAFVVPSVAFAVLAATNPAHHLVWTPLAAEPGTPVGQTLGLAAWTAIAYATVLTIICLVLLTGLLVSNAVTRAAVALVIIGLVFSRIAHTSHLANHEWPVFGDPSIASVGVPLVLYAIALHEFHLFNPVVQARKTAVDQMEDGTLVLDKLAERIIYANPAAGRLLGSAPATMQGCRATSFLPASALMVSDGVPEQGASGLERVTKTIIIGERDARRHLLVDTTLLVDSVGRTIGQLLLLRDVTELRRELASRLDEQRALAAMREREHLAREMHDGIGQVLGYVSLQAQAAKKQLSTNDVAEAMDLLDRLAVVAQHAHDDVRSEIIALRGHRDEQWNFLSALQQYATSFGRQHCIATSVTLDPNVPTEPFGNATGVQVLRAVQEAMTNARQHGRARNVDIRLKRDGSEICLTVSDDGEGFKTPLAGPSAGHYGIAFMRERAKEAGGSISLSSMETGPTVVTFRIPLACTEGNTA